MARTVVGVEITEQCVRAAEMTTGRSPRLVAAGEIDLPEGAAADSEVLDQDAVIVALRRLWSRHKFGTRRVVCGVGGRRILVREHTTAQMDPRLLRDALPYQIADVLPMPADQAVLDFYPVRTEGDAVHGLLVASAVRPLERLVDTVRRAHLVVEGVELAPFGLARIARALGPSRSTTAMVHMGPHTTWVVIAEHGIPQFVRLLAADLGAVAAPPLPDETAAEHLAALEARELPESTTTAPLRSGRAATRLAHARGGVVAEHVARVRDTIRYHEGRGGRPVDLVRLSGSGSLTLGMREAMSSTLTAKVDTLSSLDVFGGRGMHPPTKQMGLDLVGTVGFLLKEGY